MKRKRCPKCSTAKSLRSFHSNRSRQDKVQSYCHSCQHKYQNKQRKVGQATIRSFIIEQKSKPCADCSVRYHWYVMDFDHVRGKKKFKLSDAC